jgi:hypothetical protein
MGDAALRSALEQRFSELGRHTRSDPIFASAILSLFPRAIRRPTHIEMAANKEEQKPQKASKYYPAEDVAVPKKVCSRCDIPRQCTTSKRRTTSRAQCMSAHGGSDCV